MKASKQLAANMLQLYATVKTGNLSTFHTPIRHWSTDILNGSYYLQTGDEIQLSVGGPRLGFIVPQGRQALTSSIGLTERMSLFRKQALRPYKTALTIMGIVFVLAVAGLPGTTV